MFTALAQKIIGNSNDKILKGFRRTVDRINGLEETIKALSDDALKGQTEKFRQMLKDGKSLDDILPEAFATVRETARRTMGMRPFDVQLLGGIALHHGYIAEMRTGEGKTLVATLPVYLNAISGKGVHVVTVNDYLAQRDATWMTPVYKFLGLSIGYIISDLSTEERRAAYASDITYGTNNEFGFDHLRDNMTFDVSQQVQRPFNFAIVDEVDSILIDEARTPLIISGHSEESPELYPVIDRVIPHLVDEDYDLDEKRKSITLTEAGNEHAEQVMRELGIIKEGGLYDAHNIDLVHHLNMALRAHKLFKRDTDYIVKNGEVIIIDEFTGRMMEGRRWSEGQHQAVEAKEKVEIQNENQTLATITFQNYFRMYPKLAGMTGTAMTEKVEFEDIYNLRTVEIPTNLPLARVDHHDEIYRTSAEKFEAIAKLVKECVDRKQPVLVGTTSIEKSEQLSQMLKKLKIDHHVLNAKFHEQEATIVAQAGRPGAVTIATNMAGRGTDIKLGGNVEMRIAQEVPEDADDETRARMIEKIRAEVAQHYETVKDAGGLFIVASERHESRRIDNQLRGRAGRQGDAGASRFYISLEDDLMRIFGGDKMDGFLKKMGIKPGQAIIHPWINTAIEGAQKKVEAQNYEIRKELLKFDNVMNDQRRVVYDQRRQIMHAQDVSELVQDMIHETIEDLVAEAVPEGSYAEQWDMDLLQSEAMRLYKLNVPGAEWAKEEGLDAAKIADRMFKMVDEAFAEKEQIASPDGMRALEKWSLLRNLDHTWKEHLQAMDHLKKGIWLRGMGQRDPLNEYKAEAFSMFEEMLGILRQKVSEDLFRIQNIEETPPELPRRIPQGTVLLHGNEAQGDLSHLQIPDHLLEHPAGAGGETRPELIGAADFRQDDPATWAKTPRNAPCPCGSGKKYKYCHGKTT
ncbi:MAG: preprotein translocase subunit SecA [Alphaproteobacteria bacterium]|nr:preprotein translocase subunit SecA [Alphaproteobacteria bacterium]